MSVSDSEPDLEAVISSKYLRIDIQVKDRNLIKEREVLMIRSALKYAHTIMGFSRVGRDKAQVAYMYIMEEICCSSNFVPHRGNEYLQRHNS